MADPSEPDVLLLSGARTRRLGKTRGVMSSPAAGGTSGPGVVRLLNTAAGRALCLAGAVDERIVDAHLRRYGREPMPVDVIDTASVTRLSMAALDLVLDHVRAAERAGRQVLVRRSPVVDRLLGGL